MVTVTENAMGCFAIGVEQLCSVFLFFPSQLPLSASLFEELLLQPMAQGKCLPHYPKKEQKSELRHLMHFLLPSFPAL